MGPAGGSHEPYGSQLPLTGVHLSHWGAPQVSCWSCVSGDADLDPAWMRRVTEVNLTGTMLCAQAALRCFAATKGEGRCIVNISSVAAQTGSPGGYVHYAASKAAVEAFTLGLAREIAAQGIRVIAVAPGTVNTSIHALAGDPGRPTRIAPRPDGTGGRAGGDCRGCGLAHLWRRLLHHWHGTARDGRALTRADASIFSRSR